jgi:ring-1,2-phenylacetyl-CoA epoxidase subunit PaaA
MAQESLNRWWWPALMMFGPHDSDSPNTAQLMRWGIKTKTNDELRNEFVTEMIEQFEAVGLIAPDPDMVYDEVNKQWIHGPIDWDEFWQVVRGDGPLNAERIATRQKAHDDGLWVREAMVAYAQRA